MLAEHIEHVEVSRNKEATLVVRQGHGLCQQVGIPNWLSFEPFVNAFVEPIAPHLLSARRLAA
jgi:hypothetical protein